MDTIFDAHCDVLYKMESDPSLDFRSSKELKVNFKRLTTSGGKVQCFALFVKDDLPEAIQYAKVLNMIDLFYRKVLRCSSRMKLVRTKKEIDGLGPGEIGAMLTLEGCGPIGQDLVKLRTLFRLGVKSVGLTWNHANLTADGALESRGAGLSEWGRQVVGENNAYKVWTDVSHLSETGFWDVMEDANFPIASHSNARALCDHPRNLYDEQIRALAQKGSVIGVTFVPKFLNGKENGAGIPDVLRHIDYISGLVGMEHVGIGSDFDGSDEVPNNLESYSDFPDLINELQKYYSERQVEGFLFRNFYKVLPE